MLVLSSTVNTTLLLALLPLVLIDLSMVIYCIVDLYRPDRARRQQDTLAAHYPPGQHTGVGSLSARRAGGITQWILPFPAAA
jgi:hypothetical protein